MAQYNVTRDIRKLAEEAERTKTQNPSMRDMSVAGLGLGSAYYGAQTGAPKNLTQPTNLTIQANEAQVRANQANLDKATNQYRSNLNLNNLDPAKNLNINDPSDFQRSVTKNVINSTMTPPKFEAGPRPDYRQGAGEAKPAPTKQIPIEYEPAKYDAKGKPVKQIGPQMKPDSVVKNIAGGALNMVGDIADKAFKVAPLIIPDTELGDKTADDMIGMGYSGEQVQAYLRGEDPGSIFPAEEFMRGPIPQSNFIPYSERSDVEKQILANQEAGVPLFESTDTFSKPEMVDQTQTSGQLNQTSSVTKDREGLPRYQQNFLKMLDEGKEVDNATFQSAQRFALNRGLVFDPKEGFSKAQFYGQMFKGQSIGQFLRGEDAPEGYEDVMPEYNPPGSPGYKSPSSSLRKDSVEKSDYQPQEMTLSDYRKLARHQGYKGGAVNARAKQMMNEDQGKGRMTDYQRESLRRGYASDAESLRRYEETKQFNIQKHEESVRQYEESAQADAEEQELQDLKTRAQINKLVVETDATLAELGITEIPEGDMSYKAMQDYIGVAENLGYEYDFKTGVFKEDKIGGRPIDEKTFREKLEPHLSQTDYGKALLYIESQKKSK